MAIHQSKKSKKFTYKRAVVANSDGVDLQSLVSAALHKLIKPSERAEPIESLRRMIGRNKKRSEMLFGELVLFEKDKDIAFIVENDTDFDIEQLSPGNSEDGKRKREVLEGSLHFCIKGNNVIVAQTSAVRARMLENHLNWLLIEKAKVLTDDSAVQLADEPTTQAKKKYQKGGGVKRTVIGSPMMLSEEVKKESTVGAKSGGQSSTKRIRLNPKAQKIVQALVGDSWDENLFNEMDDDNLQVIVEVKFNRKATEKEHRLLDQIASATRHMEDEDTKIFLEDGTEIKGDELKLTHTERITHLNGIPDLIELYDRMKDWMTQLASTKLIE